MAILNITLPEGSNICNGKQVTFRAPCSSTGVTGLKIGDITYTLMNTAGEEIGAETSSLETTGISFIQDALVSVIIDTEQNKAFIQNGANEVFIAKYGTTTNAEIEAAIMAGKAVFLRVGLFGNIPLAARMPSGSGHTFIRSNSNTGTVLYKCLNGTWSTEDQLTHASTHASGGSDPITPEDIGAATKSVSSSVSLSSSSWTESSGVYTQSVSVSGVTASNNLVVSPYPASHEAYGKFGIYCSAQAAGSLTFTAKKQPDENISANILIVG